MVEEGCPEAFEVLRENQSAVDGLAREPREKRQTLIDISQSLSLQCEVREVEPCGQGKRTLVYASYWVGPRGH